MYDPAPESMTVAVTDALNDGTSAVVDCGNGSTSLTVSGGGTDTCAYAAAPTGKTATLNTATATIAGANFNGKATVSFVRM